MRFTAAFFGLLLALISYRLIFGDGSLQELTRLNNELRDARMELTRVQNRNPVSYTHLTLPTTPYV